MTPAIPRTKLGRLIRMVQRGVAEVTWPVLVLGLAVHVALSWLALALLDGGEIAGADVFPYYYLTTATTVGYGDYSPTTTAARYVGGFFILPGAVLMFTAVVGKLIQAVTDRWTRAMKGREDYDDLSGHVVVFGWQGDRTRRLLELLRAEDEDRPLVLVAQDLDENPMREGALFVKVPALSSDEAMARSGAGAADAVLVLGEDDDETLAAALAVGALRGPARIVSHFQTTGPAALLRSYCPSAEAQESLSVELMARAAYDPGAARIQRIMLSSLDGPTQYSFTVPEGAAATDAATALDRMKRTNDATLIGVMHADDGELLMNPPAACAIGPGDRVFYIADHRLAEDELAGVLA